MSEELNDNRSLIEKSKVVLADTFLLYMKAHSYHWNVIGSDFPLYHKFFGKLYEELHDSIDILAEEIRTLDAFSPSTLSRMIELSTLTEDEKIPAPQTMIKNLYETNDKVVETIKECYELAEESKEYAYSNILQDRLSAHAKHKWMLKSLIQVKKVQ